MEIKRDLEVSPERSLLVEQLSTILFNMSWVASAVVVVLPADDDQAIYMGARTAGPREGCISLAMSLRKLANVIENAQPGDATRTVVPLKDDS